VQRENNQFREEIGFLQRQAEMTKRDVEDVVKYRNELLAEVKRLRPYDPLN
jgi:hypothetical protein